MGVVLCGLASTAAHAAPPRFESDTHRFVPALSFFTDIVGYGGEASTSADPFDFRPFFIGIQPQEPTQGTDTILNPYLGLSFELSTPGLEDLPGDPRFFVHGDVAWTWPVERDVAKLGSPRSDEFEPLTGPTVDGGIDGQGAALSSQLAPWQFSAGAGLAFTFEVSERRFRVKPSVEYLHESVDLSGRLKEAADIIATVDPNELGLPHDPTVYRLYDQLDFSSTEVFHALGGGLEVESDMGRSGPLVMSLYFATKIYSVLNDSRVEIRRSQPLINGTRTEITGANGGTAGARYVYEHDDLVYRAGIGVRFRYSPD